MKSADYKKANGPSPVTQGASWEIRVIGHLDDSWSNRLGDLEMKLLDNGEMVLTGYLPDQAALMGILNGLYSLNLALFSVNRVNRRK
jgi:hypothetical protein